MVTNRWKNHHRNDFKSDLFNKNKQMQRKRSDSQQEGGFTTFPEETEQSHVIYNQQQLPWKKNPRGKA